MSSLRSTKLVNGVALLLAIVFTLAIATWVARTIRDFRAYPFDADEANHANNALALIMELRAGDYAGFLDTLSGQGYYPPAFTLPKMVAFLLFGETPLVARLFSLLCLVLAAGVIFLWGRELHPRWGNVVGAIALIFVLTSQPLLTMAGLTMMETPGLLITFTFLWAYLHTVRRPTALRLVLTSVLLILVFLSKYTYSLPALALVLAMAVVRFLPWLPLPAEADYIDRSGRTLSTTAHPLRQRLPALLRRWLWLLGPFALAISLWFARPGNFGLFMNYSTTQPDWAAFTWEEIIFYPRSIAYHFSPSPILALLILLAVFWAFLRWREPAVRILLLYFLIGMVEMFFNFPRNPRFIATFVPAAHLLTAAMLVDAAGRVRAPHRPRTWTAALGLIGLILMAGIITAIPLTAGRLAAYPSVMQARYETAPGLDEVAGWIQNNVPAGERFYLINGWDQLSYQSLAWKLGTAAPPGTRFPQVVMPYDTLKEATPPNVDSLRRQILESDVDYVVTFEGTPWGAPAWYVYAEEMGDMLQPVNTCVVYVDLYDADHWLDTSLCCGPEWDETYADARYTLLVKTTVYQVTDS